MPPAMQDDVNDPVDADPLETDHDFDRGGPAAKLDQTRPAAVAALLADRELRQSIGGAWPLYAMLLLSWEGAVAGTRDEIGTLLHEDGRNIGNWIKALVKAGIAEVEKSGRRMKIVLTDRHMRVALMPDIVTVIDNAGQQEEPVLSDHQQGVLRLMDQAKTVGGTVEIRVAIGG